MTAQEPDPPDVDVALRAVVKVLHDVQNELEGELEHAELALRAGALRAAVRRLVEYRKGTS